MPYILYERHFYWMSFVIFPYFFSVLQCIRKMQVILSTTCIFLYAIFYFHLHRFPALFHLSLKSPFLHRSSQIQLSELLSQNSTFHWLLQNSADWSAHPEFLFQVTEAESTYYTVGSSSKTLLPSERSQQEYSIRQGAESESDWTHQVQYSALLHNK